LTIRKTAAYSGEANSSRSDFSSASPMIPPGIVPAEQARRDDRVAEARDREQLGHALQQPKHDRLKVGDRMHDSQLGRPADPSPKAKLLARS
jgi:hypothetical protein